jgi:hypothetical protein
MKKLVTAAALAVFALATTTAMAEDTKMNSPTQKTPTQQQMDTSKGASKMAPATTGQAPATGPSSNLTGQGPKVPGKPSDSTKDVTSQGQ